MLDSALLKTNFVGRDGFVWWIGRVADSDVWRNEATDTDAGWAYRCKVRIIGYHPFDEEVLPESDLPWAHVLVDATSGSDRVAMARVQEWLEEKLFLVSLWMVRKLKTQLYLVH